uniref:Uncharacterized protein n=1 Tax=uncultured marine virus TaxID=186617 RepID=A0A0F7L3K1_9VIRU|nr:hypothetical protein [uncultured marine virus]
MLSCAGGRDCPKQVVAKSWGISTNPRRRSSMIHPSPRPMSFPFPFRPCLWYAFLRTGT